MFAALNLFYLREAEKSAPFLQTNWTSNQILKLRREFQ